MSILRIAVSVGFAVLTLLGAMFGLDFWQANQARQKWLVLQQDSVFVVLHLRPTQTQSHAEAAVAILERSGFTTLSDPRPEIQKIVYDRGVTDCSFVAPSADGIIRGHCAGPTVLSPFCSIRTDSYQRLAHELVACLFTKPALGLKGK